MMGVFVQLNEGSLNPMSRDHPIGYVIQENGCWDWTGALRAGYGRVRDPDSGRVVTAHRMMYERRFGAVPPGMELDHFYCDNGRCVNPDHVRPVAPRENVLRGDTASSRALAKTHCKHGHPFSGSNVRVSGGRRSCRTCEKAWQKSYRVAREAART